MSVDSGLSTYADVSNLPWFKTNGLTYRDLSNPDLLVKNPDWFYAYVIQKLHSFTLIRWAACCIDAYKNNKPHEGYKILSEWREKLFSRSDSKIREEIGSNPFKENLTSVSPPACFSLFLLLFRSYYPYLTIPILLSLFYYPYLTIPILLSLSYYPYLIIPILLSLFYSSYCS
jgi:hypothetical protein